MTDIRSAADLRREFARRLSLLYGTEVPAYADLVQESEAVNRDVVAAAGASAQRLGTIARVTAERHGAIRVGSPSELAEVATIFGAMGMHPVGFYDLRETTSSSLPIVATAFRPIDPDELAANPFRVFTSMLVPSDRRFFDDDLGRRLTNFLDRRTLFGPELLALARRAESDGGLEAGDAHTFLALAVQAFSLSTEPIDRSWYRELEAVSAVAADIGGVTSTHINHLTPRVLDIDSLHSRMEMRGIAMIDTIQGPPCSAAPDILLRQTSFRALDELRSFREDGGEIHSDTLRVRFGEVESRGIAVTPAGRALYDDLQADTDRAHARLDSRAARWVQMLPATELQLLTQGLAYFTFEVVTRPDIDDTTSLVELVERGAVRADPIVYEDFLPKSAAGIFRSNLRSEGARTDSKTGTHIDPQWLAGVLDRAVYDPYELYERMQNQSIELCRAVLNRPLDIVGQAR